MELKRIFAKKSTKLIILLISSLLIATASAATYFTVLIQPTAAITAAPVRFVSGNDWPTGSTMGTNQTWASLSLKLYPNATLAYDQPINITNFDSASHQFRLRNVAITPASGNAQVAYFGFINFVVENTAGTSQASFNYTTTTTTWNTPATTSYMTLPAGASWIVYVSTQANPGANDGVSANIQIGVDVQ